MTGNLACTRCALNTNQWSCTDKRGAFVEGHLPVQHGSGSGPDFDSWCHHLAYGTHLALVWLYPWSGMRQGGEMHLRYAAARRPRAGAAPTGLLQQAIDEWDVLERAGAIPDDAWAPRWWNRSSITTGSSN